MKEKRELTPSEQKLLDAIFGKGWETRAFEEKQNKESSQDRWIKVEDRLPELGERVLIFHNEIRTQIGWLGYNDMWNGHYGHVDKDHVTHWHPLPEPPKD